jgi:glyoxylate reductase
MSRPRVFVSAPLPGGAEGALRAACDVVVGPPFDRGEPRGVRSPAFLGQASTFDGLVALLTDRIDDALLARAPKLQVVANVAVGTDNVDLPACAARGVRVTNTPGVLTEATADLAFALLLSAARRVTEGDRLLRAGGFTGWSPGLLLGSRVFGMTLGIVGMGRIGRAFARRARGFGMTVLYTQRHRLAPAEEEPFEATWMPVDELFAAADAVSLHCPLTPETRHLVNAGRLARMKPGSILVNTARGGCVDEAALAHALAHGPLSACGLDVFEAEPRIHPELLVRPNAVLAPHIGSADVPTREGMAEMAAENCLAVLAGESAPNEVAP